MQKSEHKRDTRYCFICCFNSVGIVSAARVLFTKKSPKAISRIEGKASERMGRSNPQAASQRGDTQGRDIFGADRVDFIGNFEVYQIIRDAFAKQGLEYRARYFRTAWDHYGGAKLITQTAR